MQPQNYLNQLAKSPVEIIMTSLDDNVRNRIFPINPYNGLSGRVLSNWNISWILLRVPYSLRVTCVNELEMCGYCRLLRESYWLRWESIFFRSDAEGFGVELRVEWGNKVRLRRGSLGSNTLSYTQLRGGIIMVVWVYVYMGYAPLCCMLFSLRLSAFFGVNIRYCEWR